jgi:hypothetical protein
VKIILAILAVFVVMSVLSFVIHLLWTAVAFLVLLLLVGLAARLAVGRRDRSR